MKNFKTKIILLSFLLFLFIGNVWSKTDTSWTSIFNGFNSYAVEKTIDEGYILCGVSNYRSCLLKIDSNGDTIWTKIYNTPYTSIARSVKQTKDYGYIITGSTKSPFSDLLLIKTNALGDTLWTKTYDNFLGDGAYDIQITNDDGFIITGFTGYDDDTCPPNWGYMWILKTDENGDSTWSSTIHSAVEGRSIKQTLDEGYIISGYNDYDAVIVKLNSEGELQWKKIYGGNDYDRAYSVQLTDDNGFIVAGSYGHGDGYKDVWLLKLNSDGDTTWTKKFGEGGTINDEAYSVQQTKDNGYIMTGYRYSRIHAGWGSENILLIRTDAFGDSLWTFQFGDSGMDRSQAVREISGNNYIVTGFIGSNLIGDNKYGAFISKITETPNNVSMNPFIKPNKFILHQNYPNPFNPLTSINFYLPKSSFVIMEVYNTLGQKVETLLKENINSGYHVVHFNALSLPSGIYYYKIQAGEYHSVKKMLLLQ